MAMSAAPDTTDAPASAPIADSRRNLVGMGRDEMAAALAEMGEPRFRADQLFHWIYARGATDFADMTNIAKGLRARLDEHYKVARPLPAREQHSRDGTHKWLLRMADGSQVEMVHIPEEDRGALCVSSQVGCTLTCKFCHTGTQRLVRNLEPAEIVGQIMLARDFLGEWPTAERPSIYERQLSNIVMMGMGEPLYNFDNVSAALKIVMDGEGIAISRRRITLSTAGVVPMIRRCGVSGEMSLTGSARVVVGLNAPLASCHFSKNGAMSAARSLITGRLASGAISSRPFSTTLETCVRQVHRGRPLTVMAQEPHTPTRHANR